ncbi:hypothetical protein KDL44_01015 [bacterium]|nr:hypothetical protein [bacterium]
MSAMHISHPPGRIRPPAAPLPLFRSLAMLQADMLALTVLCILAILLSACSAGPGPEIMLTDDDSALQEVANAETPAGVDNTLFAELRAELERVLGTRETLRAPEGSSNEIHDLLLSGSDISGWELSWSYCCTGDYDLNGEVNISDLTPIGLHYRARFGDPEWHQARLADGDGNGELNIADVTPIGIHYGTSVGGFHIYGADDPAGPWQLIGQFEPERAQLAARLRYTLQQREHNWYQVRPHDRTDNEGEPGDCMLHCTPALLQQNAATETANVQLGPAGGSISGPDAGFGAVQFSIPAGALAAEVGISVGSIDGTVQLAGAALGGQLFYIRAETATELAQPLIVRAYFDPQDAVVAGLMQARLDGRLVQLNTVGMDLEQGWVEAELYTLYPPAPAHSAAASPEFDWQPSGTLGAAIWLVREYQHDLFEDERFRYSSGFDPAVDYFSTAAPGEEEQRGNLGRLMFAAWYFNSYAAGMGPLATRFNDPQVQAKIASRACTSFLIGFDERFLRVPYPSRTAALEQIKLAMRRSGGPVPMALLAPDWEAVPCLAISYSGSTLRLVDARSPHAVKSFDIEEDATPFRMIGDGSIAMYENFENILLDATAEPPFGGYEAASVNITSPEAGQRIEEQQVQLTGYVDSTYLLVDEILFWNTSLPLQSMQGTDVAVSGDFSLTLALQPGVNEFVVITRSQTTNGLTSRPYRVTVANNLENPGSFWLLQGEEPLPEGQLRFSVEWEGRYESNTVAQNYEYKPYLAIDNDTGNYWLSYGSRGSLENEPHALWEDRTQYDSEGRARSGRIVITVADVRPGTYSILLDAPVLSLNVIRVTEISVAGPTGGTYVMQNGVAAANQRWHGLSYSTDGNTVTVEDTAYSLGGI